MVIIEQEKERERERERGREKKSPKLNKYNAPSTNAIII